MKILQYYERLDLGLETTPHFKRPQYMSVYIAVFIFYKNNYVLKAFIGYFNLSIYLVITTYPWSQF